MLCNKCKIRNSCTKLCEAAEAYVDQDRVPQTELCYEDFGLDIDNVGITDDKYSLYENMYGTTTSEKKLIYYLHFIDRKDPKHIASYISYSWQHIYKIIRKIKEGIAMEPGESKKRILSLHFIKRMSAKDISNELKLDYSYIHKTISTYIGKHL